MNTAAPQVDLASMILAMLVVIGLIFACAWFVRRISGGVSFNNQLVKIRAITNLGVKEKLVLIEVDGKHLLLGVTQSQINTLKEFDEPLNLDGEPQASLFSDKLKSLIKGSSQWQESGKSTKE